MAAAWDVPSASAAVRSPFGAPPRTPQAGCVTLDPFAALGGGTCVNGGWLPPGMSASPGTPAPPLAPPPEAGCVTPDPFVAFGGGTCVNGGWQNIARPRVVTVHVSGVVNSTDGVPLAGVLVASEM